MKVKAINCPLVFERGEELNPNKPVAGKILFAGGTDGFGNFQKSAFAPTKAFRKLGN